MYFLFSVILNAEYIRKIEKDRRCLTRNTSLDTSRGPESPSFIQEKPKLHGYHLHIDKFDIDSFVDLGYIQASNYNYP